MVIILILFFAALVQGLAGFALAIVAIPLLVWTGLPLSEAIALSGASVLIQSVTGMLKLRCAVPWRQVLPAACIRLATLPLGLLILTRIHQLNPAVVRAFVGSSITVLVLAQILLRIEPRDRVSRFWDVLAFASSGLFAGMVGMGGPPLVAWLAMHRWEADRVRAFLFANFAILAPVNLLLIGNAFGPPAFAMMGKGLVLAPVVVLGTILGVKWGSHFSREAFRRILLGGLLMIGILSIMTAML